MITGRISAGLGLVVLAVAGCSGPGTFVETSNTCDTTYYIGVTELDSTMIMGRNMSVVDAGAKDLVKFSSDLPRELRLWVGTPDGTVTNIENVDLAKTGSGIEDDPFRVSPSDQLCRDVAAGIAGEV